jgi:hypothetical protein
MYAILAISEQYWSYSSDDGLWQNRADAVAALLGVRRVGWVIAHPPREEGFFLSGKFHSNRSTFSSIINRY